MKIFHTFFLKIRLLICIKKNQNTGHTQQLELRGGCPSRQGLCFLLPPFSLCKRLRWQVQLSPHFWHLPSFLKLRKHARPPPPCSTPLYECPVAAITNYHKPVNLREIYCLSGLKAEVQNQGLSRDGLSLKALGENPSSPPPAPGDSQQCLAFPGLKLHHSHLCLHYTWPVPCVSVSKSSSSLSCEDTSRWISPPHYQSSITSS